MLVSSDLNDVSLISSHVALASLTSALALSYVGSRKKILAIIIGCASVFYTVCVGIARMASPTGRHLFSDVLVTGFIAYTVVLFIYYWILDVPGQEKVYRHKLTTRPFNDGYKMILDGKTMLDENSEEAFTKISAGLEILAKAKVKAEDINQHGHDYSLLISRINDIVSRIGILVQERPVDPVKWSYFC